jgi:hypothetical protein
MEQTAALWTSGVRALDQGVKITLFIPWRNQGRRLGIWHIAGREGGFAHRWRGLKVAGTCRLCREGDSFFWERRREIGRVCVAPPDQSKSAVGYAPFKSAEAGLLQRRRCSVEAAAPTLPLVQFREAFSKNRPPAVPPETISTRISLWL